MLPVGREVKHEHKAITTVPGRTCGRLHRWRVRGLEQHRGESLSGFGDSAAY